MKSSARVRVPTLSAFLILASAASGTLAHAKSRFFVRSDIKNAFIEIQDELIDTDGKILSEDGKPLQAARTLNWDGSFGY